MKRISALLIALLMLCLLLPTSAMAEEEKPFWVTHFDDCTAEGAGSIFTSEYQHAGWWIHFAFAPTDVEGVYQIVETANGLSDGTAIPLAIPEGGFVWAANFGNNYPSINPDGSGTDYTSENCTNCINDVAANWMTGTLVKFNGLDLEAMTVPTSTPDVNWYDDAYVCTATYSIYLGEANVVTPGDESEAESEAASEAESKEESKEESVAATESSEAPADDEEGGLGTGALIAIIAAAVVVVAVVVVVVIKKKK